MDFCRRCLLILLTLVLPGFLHFASPILMDRTQMFSDFGFWDTSHLAGMPGTPDRMKFDHNIVLDKDGGVKLSWNFTDESITFKLSAETPGWIGVGISRSRFDNKGADFVVMGFRDDGNYITDMHINHDGKYVIDEEQNVKAEYIWGTDFDTFAIFNRPLVTCDHDEDIDITTDTLRIIWAYGAEDIEGQSPMNGELSNTNSGSANVKLLNPTSPPIEKDNAGTDIMTIEVKMNNISLEMGERHRCTAFQFPDLTSTQHIIQFEPILTEESEGVVRQITILECQGNYQDLESKYRADYRCEDNPAMSKCGTVAIKWAIGMPTFTFPKETGYLIGKPDTFFVMEISYENLERRGTVDSSGMRMYYTPTPRDYNAGVLTTGSLVHESQIIPPGSPDFRLQGHCMKTCIQLAFNGQPTEQVTIFAALLHARELGRKIRVRHFRDGEELSPIAEDNGLHYLHNEPQFLGRKVHLKKGDNMIVECTYNTFDRSEITYVNNSQGGESCLAYLNYYPRIAALTACETAPTENVIMATVGAARPEEMKKSAEQFKWTSQQTREFNDKVLASQVYVHCGGEPLKDPQPIPEIKEIYVEKYKCRKPEPEVQANTNSTHNNGKAENSAIITPGKNVITLSISLLFSSIFLTAFAS